MSISWSPYIAPPRAVTQDALLALADRLNIVLPADLSHMLLFHAGQVTEPETLRISEKRETPFGPVLYANGQNSDARYTYSVEFALRQIAGWRHAQEGATPILFPFASNSASGWFCARFIAAKSKPDIVFVDLNYDAAEDGAVTSMASSLTDLLGKLGAG